MYNVIVFSSKEIPLRKYIHYSQKSRFIRHLPDITVIRNPCRNKLQELILRITFNSVKPGLHFMIVVNILPAQFIQADHKVKCMKG